MAVISFPRDANRVTVIAGTSSSDGVTPTLIYVDPTSHRMLVNATSGGGGSLTVGTTTISNGTNTFIEYNNNGVLGEYSIDPTLAVGTGALALNLTNANTWTALQTFGTDISIGGVTATGATGTGNIVFASSPSLTTPSIGAATGTSLVLTNTSAAGFAVGANGATNPVLTVDSSVTSQADGIIISGKATGAGTTITAVSGSTSSNIALVSQGTTGNVILNCGVSGSVELQTVGGTKLNASASAITITGRLNVTDQVATSTSSRFSFTGAADTSLTAGTEAPSVFFSLAQTRQWASNTTVSLQRAVRISQPTYSFATAGGTITEASTFVIDGAPVAGTNAAITTAYTLKVVAGLSFFGGHMVVEGVTSTGATGTGNFVFATSPTFITPTLGIATSTNEIFTNNAVTATSNAATVPVTSRLTTVTNSSASTLTITITTSGATDGQLLMVRVLDFSGVAETITWVNTENSTVTAPTTSNGSTTLFLTVGFIYNGGTSKWRCIASA